MRAAAEDYETPNGQHHVCECWPSVHIEDSTVKLELEAERDRDEGRVALLREHGVKARFDKCLEATQVERDATTDVETELRLRVADVEAAEVAGHLHVVDAQTANGVRPCGRCGIAERDNGVADEVQHARG